MKLNRWTILAIILLLSTAVGLLFRPLGDGPSGSQVIEEQGLSLACPKSLTVASLSGGRVDLECEIVAESELPTDYKIWGSVSEHFHDVQGIGNDEITEIAAGRYILTQSMYATNTRTVRVRAYAAKGQFPPVDQAATTHVDIRVPRQWPYYVAQGLSLLQFAILMAGPLFGIILGVEGLVVYRGSAKAIVRFSIKRTVYAVFLIIPWLHLVMWERKQEISAERARLHWLAIDALWNSYLLQAALMISLHVTETIPLQLRLAWVYAFGPGFFLILTIPFSLMVVTTLFVLRKRFFTRIAPTGALTGDGMTLDKHGRGRQPILRPFVAAAVVGWVLLPLVIYINWFVWV